jgi:hypothetical protein
VKLREKIRTLTVTAVTLGVVGGGMLTAGDASAQVIYYCEGNLCMGNINGNANNPDVAMHADEYQFYGHYELQTPDHRTFNSADHLWGTGTGSNHAFGSDKGGNGKYCGTAWENNGNGYDKIGYICENF